MTSALARGFALVIGVIGLAIPIACAIEFGDGREWWYLVIGIQSAVICGALIMVGVAKGYDND